MQYQSFFESPNLNLTGCARDSLQPGKAWATSNLLGLPGFGYVFDLTLVPNVNPASKIVGLDFPQDVLAVGQTAAEHRLYVSQTRTDKETGPCQVLCFDPGNGVMTPGQAEFTFEVPGPAGQLANVGEWLLVVAGDTIYKYRLPPFMEGPTAVVTGIAGGSRVVAVTGEAMNAVIYYLHNGDLNRVEVNLEGNDVVAAKVEHKFNQEALPTDATGQLSILLGQVLIPITTLDSNEIARVREDGTVTKDVIDDYPPLPNNVHSAMCPDENGQVFSVSTSSYGVFDYFESQDILALGIGFIPFTRIIQDPGPEQGRADTSVDPGYFFQVNKVPFGGSIHLMINHKKALVDKIVSYKVSLAGQQIMNSYVDYRWDLLDGNWLLVTVAPGPNGYPVRNVDEELWYNPRRGVIIPTGLVPDGAHELTIEFLDENAVVVESASHILLIENSPASLQLHWPVIAGVPGVPVCGCIKYGEKSDSFSVEYLASHPTNDGTYGLYFYRGGAYLGSISQTGPVQPVPQIKDGITVFDIMGNCNVALVQILLSVRRLVTTGYGWIPGYHTWRRFTLVPDTVQLEG